MSQGQEILPGVTRFTAVHPEWDDDCDGWEPEVAWWSVDTPAGLILIDPLVDDWDQLDALVLRSAGCAGIIRTSFWHQRSIAEAHQRYRTQVWAMAWPAGRPRPDDAAPAPFDHAVRPGETLPGDLLALDVGRDDELGLWLGGPRALMFGDVMIRRPGGELALCPEHWVGRNGGHPNLRRALAPLRDLEPAHVLVCHGPLALGDGPQALAAAIRTGN